MVRPLNAFCCGCPIRLGAFLILVLNLIQNLFYISATISNVILKIPTFGYGMGLTTQTFNGSWCMLGLPFIAIGLCGVWYRLESHVRLYFGYLVVSFIMDMCFLVWHFLVKDVCLNMPPFLKMHGSAFACGSMRIFSILLVAQIFMTELYFVFTVWSLCEDLKAGGSHHGFPELLNGAHEAQQRHHYHATYTNSLFGAPIAPGYPRPYGALNQPRLSKDVTEFAFPTAHKVSAERMDNLVIGSVASAEEKTSVPG
eukprot:CAMPEP_0168386218 /NCGR_PEP_ID=MMETSP0228-20121227/15314_1 /TAXON_ID=133427 /ORGANISM="Protoceratium reticulatum, Strain CCCM 535 (=CCMP 1889)" /LENGTH=254 /DNA_ID=CAMNT_0008399411 /DNA_START=19 /DNA_END=780 /DNA_ORIENTATION=-